MNELETLRHKADTEEMSAIEWCIYWADLTNTDEESDLPEQAAADLARITAERDAYRKGYEAAQVFAERLRREDRVKYFIGGYDVVLSLIEYAAALKQSS